MSVNFGKTLKKALKSQDKIYTPRYMDWVGKNPNFIFSQETIDEVMKHLNGGDNSKRSGRFGASSRGDCPRRQMFVFAGTEIPKSYDHTLHVLFHDGTIRHAKHQLIGLESGIFDAIEYKSKWPTMNLSVSADGANKKEQWLFELKGTRFMFAKPPEKHVLQVATYMLMFPRMDRMCYVAENKSDCDWEEWVFTRDDLTAAIDQVTEELMLLNDHVDAKTLPPIIPACELKMPPYTGCPYNSICLDAGNDLS